MKIVQLGCGITGLVCAEHLEKNELVNELVLADRWTDAAEAMAERLDSGKISVRKVDATDSEVLRDLLTDADLLISSIPAELNKNVIDKTIELGVDYIDYSMSVNSMEEFEEINRRSKDRGVTILTSMGADPGISDVFARYAANKLDSAESARVMDGDSAVADGIDFFCLWSPAEMIEEVTVPAAIFKDGKITYVPPLNERQIYEFPEPIGPLPVYNTIHEETFLMSHFIDGLKYADFRIAVDDVFAKVANTLRKLGMHSLKPVDVKGVKVRPIDVVTSLMPKPVDMIGKVKGFAGLVVEVRGLKDGRKALVKVWATMSHEKAYDLAKSNATGYFVGTGGAIAAELLLSGEIADKGVLVPEQLPAEKYVSMLPAKHLEVKEEITTF
ncbi:MAG: saccharopine dehydrogenase NADP-binding domain-containing protein [Methanobacteriota archaeon]|nr:MAG: saccharopine dehydrogenase NADP-binding domain-containing protein [Euryarchaeota archaeon]